MDRFICIHGHFYQPARVNPWLETIELQEDAYPYHDWNEKITAECYMVNGGSHILNSEKKIKKIFNNYSWISFNFGPTLLSWIRSHDRRTYKSIIEADLAGREKFSGHGSAIAQIYNHLIMPLANKQDKLIQVSWAIKDFEFNFGRKPEGIWLSETAVDIETLEILAESGIKFTILSPAQALRIRKLNPDLDAKGWIDVKNGKINTRMPYLCGLPNGSVINVFFYDSVLSNELAFGNLLSDGEIFAKSLIQLPQIEQELPEIIVVATDGETYGHHHKFGDMALAYCLDLIESKNLAKITVFGQYLEKYSPVYEVEIKENSSWSCNHGICRWKEDCGCTTGTEYHPDWNQKWRVPLRQAIDWLADKSSSVYRSEIKKYLKIEGQNSNSWIAASNYIDIINNRSEENIDRFINLYFTNFQQQEKAYKNFRTEILKLMEMYRHALLMQSSDGWFFDDISRIETVQILRHACRVIEIIKETTGEEYEQYFTNILKNAESNIGKFGDGQFIYQTFVKTAVYDFKKIAALLAFKVLYGNTPEEIYSFKTVDLSVKKILSDNSIFICGTATIIYSLTLDSYCLDFAAYYHKDKNLLSGTNTAAFTKICKNKGDSNIEVFSKRFKEFLEVKKNPSSEHKNDEIYQFLNEFFEGNAYTLKDFLKDIQVELIEKLIMIQTEAINPVLLSLFSDYENILEEFKEKRILNYFLDGIFPNIHEFIGEILFYYKFKGLKLDVHDMEELKTITGKVGLINLINRESFNILATKKLSEFMDFFESDYENLSLLKNLSEFINILKETGIIPNLWKSQNIGFMIKEKFFNTVPKKEHVDSKKWLEYFSNLVDYLGLQI